MEEELKELLERYKEELEGVKGFNPCLTCCDMTSANANEYMLERFISELEKIVG